MARSNLYVGLMSGTSLDGIDAVVASFDGGARLLESHYQPFDAELRAELFALQAPGDDEIHRASLAANRLARAYAAAVQTVLAKASLRASDIAAIGCHGQTVRHRPDAGYTTQLGNAALLAEMTGITVVNDFRSRDIAAGGQGAPLVPAFHRELFASRDEHRVIVNIGGIANITDLPAAGPVTGFDCGPGNALMDEWVSTNLGHAFDRDGAWAATGLVLPEILNHLILNDFFEIPPPKSTGREVFHLGWVKQALRGGERAQDVQATLLELTAQGIAQAITRHCAPAQALFICGGGAHNRALMTRLAALLPRQRVADTGVLGLHVDWVEAVAFAWLARQTLLAAPGNLPAVTGAAGQRVLGAIYPA
ncbi:MAG: anhydro-N-acetylmuramic acid kinase [Betaproteobacteria bacterium]|nr:anhydro-N-acetylmuramic acid kinase [Betaproteobacteria bacterium]